MSGVLGWYVPRSKRECRQAEKRTDPERQRWSTPRFDPSQRTSYLGALSRRLIGRLGRKRTAVAVGHAILVIAYHLMKSGGTYKDLGPNYFDEQNKEAVVRRAVRRIQNLGYTVSIQTA